MNIMANYTQTCRLAMQTDLFSVEKDSQELKYSIVLLRQSLSCCVCCRLLNTPTGPAHKVCEHFVCKSCIGGQMVRVKPSCSWCKDYSDFEESTQLRIVVDGFRKLCGYIVVTPIGLDWLKDTDDETDYLPAILRDATSIDDMLPMHISKKDPSVALQRSFTLEITVKSAASKVEETRDIKNERCEMSLDNELSNPDNYPNENNIDIGLNSDSVVPAEELMEDNAEEDTYKTIPTKSNVEQRIKGKTKNVSKQKSFCRCGTFQKANNFTCKQSKCPCYLKHQSCVSCRCRSCKNPNGPNVTQRVIKRKTFSKSYQSLAIKRLK